MEQPPRSVARAVLGPAHIRVLTLLNLNPLRSGASCLSGRLSVLSNKLFSKYKTILMFHVTLNLLFKPQRLAHAPHSSCSSNQGSLWEMTLSVFRAVVHEGCSHVQAHTCTLIYLLG